MDQQPSACPTEEMQPMTPAGGPAALTCGSTEAVPAWGDELGGHSPALPRVCCEQIW